jgi:hypothetical protein
MKLPAVASLISSSLPSQNLISFGLCDEALQESAVDISDFTLKGVHS